MTRLIVACVASLLLTLLSPVVHAQGLASLQVTPLSSSSDEGRENSLIEVTALPEIKASSQQELADQAQQNPALLTLSAHPDHGASSTMSTGSSSTALFSGLSEGVYLVREVPQWQGDILAEIASPVLVLLRGGDTVRMSLKAEPVTVTKSADVSSARIGQRVTYTIDAGIPHPDSLGRLHRFVISDDLDPRLKLVEAQQPTLSPDGALDAARDYTLETTPSRVALTFTDHGLSTLAQHRQTHPNARVRLTLVTEVTGGAVGKKIDNTAQVLIDGRANESLKAPTSIWITDESSGTPPAGGGAGPGANGSEGNPASQSPQGSSWFPMPPGTLASTGASVLWILGIGFLAIVLGLILLRSKRSSEDDQ
ncbi:isopeptide-forming domain-containing fimbrial protein [Corynebacterium tapiri]|uniref:Isopeptide-forming domain-containing fimbrial protein n=1 Tax=Corynebacterium tapiri TaxID=1448266 RepID=A0A5C4U2F3_9CORY|nr:isopeptide-forming domain-containing fimbrial protein [Corynebacterium tapiri]TNL96638.1 isopeptide-forming domain-containing fimbrial protein [Corynebacterium tapiri]